MNVTSIAFVGKYLETGMPLVTKRLTVEGDIIKKPRTWKWLLVLPFRSCWTSAAA